MINFKIGDKIVINDTSKIIGNYVLKLKEDTEYLVVGVSDVTGCPCIDVGTYSSFLVEEETPYIELFRREPITKETLDYIKRKHPYIPPNEEIDKLLIILTNTNIINTK